MVITDTICSDADLQVRLGGSVIERACKSVADRDALRQVALDDTVRAYGERVVDPIPEASLNAATLKRPVTARTCALIMMRAFGVEGDSWEKRRELYQAEWEAIVSGQSATTDSGGGTTTPTEVVRTPAISVRAYRR